MSELPQTRYAKAGDLEGLCAKIDSLYRRRRTMNRRLVVLGFGSDIFTGDTRWLEIGVRPGAGSGGDPYTPLSPRQLLTAAPYALYAPAAGSASRANDLDCVACINSAEISPNAVDATKIVDASIGGADIAPDTILRTAEVAW